MFCDHLFFSRYLFLNSGKQLQISKNLLPNTRNLLPNSRNQLQSVTQQGKLVKQICNLKFRYTTKKSVAKLWKSVTHYPTLEICYTLPNSRNLLPIPNSRNLLHIAQAPTLEICYTLPNSRNLLHIAQL